MRPCLTAADILYRLLLEAQDAQKVLLLLQYLFNGSRLQQTCREDWLQVYDKEVRSASSSSSSSAALVALNHSRICLQASISSSRTEFEQLQQQQHEQLTSHACKPAARVSPAKTSSS